MLTTEQLQSIANLQKECETNDGNLLKLNWDMLRQREDQAMDFFHYVDGELVAYLALYGFGSTVEICGMVKPAHRNQNHFTNLWHQALLVIKEKGYKKILLNAPSTSQSAKEWLEKQPCTYDFSEYQMVWKRQSLEEGSGVLLRQSTEEDVPFEIELDVLGFGMSLEDATIHQQEVKNYPNDAHFIIEADGKRLGKIRVSRNDGESYIYGFVIHPDFQGKGYGRKALQAVVHLEQPSGNPIRLEVEAKNRNALRLYESIGFQTVQGQDYYLWDE
ncbi:GNAT family N-acetyltransferase [Sporosarcina thermotolerans]|uniref:GNAT family N-acetyltransferase n=1 Tax=Sporosarcina thermotolerans TaxID=633404 RepID=A0AAW9A8S3_9BACL|nr:GNAT family N-acetyltransferase [Sporosarcina thermotolerans]MDW0116569.1 GNAT family N-acetyltransferase [Sporosarcina thermotolerans]WHT48792.1 GNAT family N-acetyltransferase [Sporosarcina thermotolerans]